MNKDIMKIICNEVNSNIEEGDDNEFERCSEILTDCIMDHSTLSEDELDDMDIVDKYMDDMQCKFKYIPGHFVVRKDI